MEIAIGTAQFGLDYGVTNRDGLVAPETAAAILSAASALGCRWLDTAAAYGNSESVLGHLPESHGFHICTKLGSDLTIDPDSLAIDLTQSLTRLGRPSADALLMHRSEWLRGNRASNTLRWARNELENGRIGSFGVSLYTPDEIEAALHSEISWVQLPISILAQSWITSGALETLRAAGKRVQARSILCQGLVAADPDNLPDALDPLRAPLTRLRDSAKSLGESPIALALAYAKQAPVDMLVIGVETPEQLSDSLATAARHIRAPWSDFACPDPKATDPRCWPPGIRISA